MKILIADDHPIVRKGIQMTLDALDYVTHTESVETHAEVLRAVRNDTWDLVVMDLDMPDGDALNTLSQLQAAEPDLPVLIVSVHPEDSFALRVLRSGAAGYLHKASAVDELEAAVARIRSGRRYVSPEMAEQLLSSVEGEAKDPHEALSDREMQVMLRLADGATVSEIGEQLNLSPKTVSTYRSRLFEKLGFDTVADVVRYALEHELID
ncbi:response regulator transcription factor [Persicimonas caeni]|uniref:Response regulator transcription factor n=1 Tax=Persicimonas caeni TaxID=2292766 RepID=A0A4Y6PV81_PERCE|nr:response regulator transcription factor [Persicimonas caeni]QDG52232.1 response regulator transcription factor [Persicimonas caeni]QED33454.1 response regulator transcription factor [Persicimonas caeni]